MYLLFVLRMSLQGFIEISVVGECIEYLFPFCVFVSDIIRYLFVQCLYAVDDIRWGELVSEVVSHSDFRSDGSIEAGTKMFDSPGGGMCCLLLRVMMLVKSLVAVSILVKGEVKESARSRSILLVKDSQLALL